MPRLRFVAVEQAADERDSSRAGDSMKHEFSSDQSQVISSGAPSVIESTLQVAGLSERIFDVNVQLNITHTWTSDLRISLIAPSGDSVLLVSGEGSSGDHFKDTVFDDSGVKSIQGQAAPFEGTFKPEESLSKLNEQNPNGTWTLRIEDRALQDGGSLNAWKLTLETWDPILENASPMPISSGPPNTVVSSVAATGLGGLVVYRVEVAVRLKHTWVEDLRLTLLAPDGTEVLLFNRRGGNNDDLNDTTFADDAPQSIAEAQAPFAGRFRPEEPLLLLREHLAEGIWSLRVEDMASDDGGVLESFRLQLFTKRAETTVESSFNIQLRFMGGLTASQRSVFELAKARWQEIITGDLPTVEIDGEEIDDLLIEASGEAIDGAGRVLGQAGPTHVRTGSLLPCKGVMAFDVADLADMEANGSLVDVIIHEMGHVIGLGTLWHDKDLVAGANTSNPEFTGARSQSVYANLRGQAQPLNVPLENEGGAGTAEGHWREVTFDNELMTGFIDPGSNPLSRLSIAALEDLGYQVNYGLADSYSLPTPGHLLLELHSSARRFRCPVKPTHPKRVPPK